MVIQVSDSASNRNEQIENAAKAIGRSQLKRSVFEAIHHHKKRVKTVAEISAKTGLSRMQVLKAGGELARKHVVEQTQENGDTAYEKNDFLQAHKKQVLALAGNRTGLARYPTKRNPRSVMFKEIQVPVSTADVEQITIDDIDNFSEVRGATADGHLSPGLSETAFKRGVQKILGEPGTFKDWGGERNDLLSTRLRLNGRRRTVAFAFKGPGTSGPLTPKKMGKNADQLQRLFQSPADVYIVQYWREINENVLEQMKALALAKSATSADKVWFGLVDGYDSRRLFDARIGNTSAKRTEIPSRSEHALGVGGEIEKSRTSPGL